MSLLRPSRYAFDSARRDDYFSEYDTMESTFAVLAEALHGEIDQLNSLQRNVVLCEGECRGTFAGWTIIGLKRRKKFFSGGRTRRLYLRSKTFFQFQDYYRNGQSIRHGGIAARLRSGHPEFDVCCNMKTKSVRF